MSAVIKRVPTEIIKHESADAWCHKCGIGNGRVEEFLGKPCWDCGAPLVLNVHRWTQVIPAYVVVRCDCGKHLACYNFTNTCECGADYNFGGQRLAPRECWGEETGEHWSDCY